MTASRAERQEARELESEVLATLWAADRALTAAEIQADLGGELAYTHSTLQVILLRLCAQDLIQPAPGPASAPDADSAYEPVRDAAEITAQVMHQTLDRKPARRQARSRDTPAPQPGHRPTRRSWTMRTTSNTPVHPSPPAPVPPARPQGDPPRCPHTTQP